MSLVQLSFNKVSLYSDCIFIIFQLHKEIQVSIFPNPSNIHKQIERQRFRRILFCNMNFEIGQILDFKPSTNYNPKYNATCSFDYKKYSDLIYVT